jgi:hypothetical protein
MKQSFTQYIQNLIAIFVRVKRVPAMLPIKNHKNMKSLFRERKERLFVSQAEWLRDTPRLWRVDSRNGNSRAVDRFPVKY